MKTIELGSIGRFQSGGTPSKKEASYFGGDIPWITTVALNGKIIDEKEATDWLTEEGVKNSATKLIPAFSLMVGTRVGVGKVAVNRVDMCINQDIISIVDINKEKWDMDYLRFFVQSSAIKLNSLARGATIKGIKLEVLQQLKIPQISLEEQKCIVSVLGGIQEIIEFETKQLEDLDTLIKSRFVEMFGDMTINPNEWEVTSLGKVCDVRDGTHDSPKYFAKGYPLVTSKNVTSGKIDFTDCSLICEEDYNKINERSKVDFGDILMPMIGTVGKPVIVDVDAEFAIKNVALIKFYENSKVTNVFVKALLQSDYFDRVVMRKIRGGTQKFIALGDIRKLKICVPPMEVQKQFATFVVQTDKSKLLVQKLLDETQQLFDALMQKYFS